MIDLFVEGMQALCIAGLTCGAYYAIAYGGRTPWPKRPLAVTTP